MRKVFGACLVVCLWATGVAAADIQSEIDRTIRSIEQKYPVRLEYKGIPQSSDTTALYEEAGYDDFPKLLKFLKLFEEEINKYPVSFFRNSNLNKIYFVKKFFYSEHPTEGFYSPAYRIIFLEFGRRYNRQRMIHNIHHEIFHLLEHQGRLTRREAEDWLGFNVKGFQYGQEYSPSVFSKDRPPYKGFVTFYATTKPQEDRAEVFAGLMVAEQSRLIHRWIDNDDILREKVGYIKGLGERFCSDLNDEFWAHLQKHNHN